MLQLSKATDYALLFLASLSNRPGHRWSVREAAEELKISRTFLANIVHQLARRNIIVTSKGSGGGVELRRKPRGITLRDVIEVFEGPLSFVDCDGCGPERSNSCSMHTYWDDLRIKMVESFTKTTIEDIGGN